MKIYCYLLISVLSATVVAPLQAMSKEKGKLLSQEEKKQETYKELLHILNLRKDTGLRGYLTGYSEAIKGLDIFDVNWPDGDGKTLLHHSINDYTYTEWLLNDAKANPNIQDKEGYTPLHCAVAMLGCNPRIVRLLLEKGALTNLMLKVKKTDKSCWYNPGATPLMLAYQTLEKLKRKQCHAPLLEKHQEIYDMLLKADKSDESCGYIVKDGRLIILE